MTREQLRKINEFMFNKKESVVVSRSEIKYNSQMEHIQTVVALMKNLSDLGYELDSVVPLLRMSKEDLKELVYEPLLAEAKRAKGAHVEHRLLFKNFPDDVISLDIDTLSSLRFASYFTTAVDSYFLEQDPFSDGSLTRSFMEKAIALSEKEKEEFGTKQEKVEDKVRTIKLVSEDEYFTMVKNILGARSALSPYDTEIVKYTIDNFDKERYMPEKVQFKETQVLIDKYNFEKRYFDNIDIKSINDFKRLLVSLSNGDPSSKKNQKIKNFSNQERKALYDIFKAAIESNAPIMIESMSNRKAENFSEYVLKKHLHFNDISKDGFYQNFMKKVELHKSVTQKYDEFLRNKDYVGAATVLSKSHQKVLVDRCRNLIWLAYKDYVEVDSNSTSFEIEQGRKKQSLNTVLDKINKCLDYCDVNSLLTLKKVMTKDQLPYNYYFPKTKDDKFTVKANKAMTYPKELNNKVSVMIDKAIERQLATIEMNGTVQIKEGTKLYADELLKKCPIPSNGRLDQNKNRSAATGTRFPIEEGPIFRAALYKQADHDQFIDFSVGIMDENFKIIGQVSWNNLREKSNGKLLGYHSGDSSRCSGKGHTEVIDLDLDVVKEVYPTAAYLAYMAVMWDGNKTSSCNELFMVLMPAAEFGIINGLDPKKVDFKIDIANEASTCVPMLVDIKNKEAIIVNLGLTGKDWRQVAMNQKHFNLPLGCECIENYAGQLGHMLHAYETLDVPTMYDLAMAYVNGRGAELVDDPSLADVIFAIDRIKVEDKRPVVEGVENIPQIVISPFDKDVIMGELIPVPLAKLTKDLKKEKAVETKEIVETEIDFERE